MSCTLPEAQRRTRLPRLSESDGGQEPQILGHGDDGWYFFEIWPLEKGPTLAIHHFGV